MASLTSSPSSVLPSSSHSQKAETSVLKLNDLRIAIVAKRIHTLLLMSSSAPFQEIVKLCYDLARSIDFAVINNVTSPIAPCLPSLVKQVYQHRNDASLHSAVTLLMISVKNACTNGWFGNGESDELLKMANELLCSFCISRSITTEVSNVLTTILKIIPRYYPQLKLRDVLVSFEAKSGYDILVSDFQIKKCRAPEETIRLFVAQTDNLERASCLISPPQVSFLVNGMGVLGRTNVSKGTGPQYPTDITKMLRLGTNIIQAAGHFSGDYIIAVAYVGMVSSTKEELKDYVELNNEALTLDPEIVEVSSRISLNCPISFRRIKTPVKGHLCKHHQCFDYDNFMDMNSRMPTWCCPCCNQPISFIDLCIDRNMVKILADVAVDITDVLVSAGGSWKVICQPDGNADHLNDGEPIEQIDCEVGDATKNFVELIMVEDDRVCRNISDIEDRKPFKELQSFHVSSIPTPVSYSHSVGTLESLVPTNILNPVISDTTANVSINQQAPTFQNMEMQPPQSGSSIMSCRPEWRPVPRQVSRVPLGIQALPLRLRSPNSWTQTQTPIHNSNFNIPRGSSSIYTERLPSSTSTLNGFDSNQITSGSNLDGNTLASHQTVSSMIAIPGCDVDVQQVSSTADLVGPPEQLHSIIQNQGQGCQYFPTSVYQQMGVLPTLTQESLRFPNIQQVSADRVPLQSLSDYQTPLHQSPNAMGQYPTLGEIMAVERAAFLARLQPVRPIASTAGTSPPIMAENSQFLQPEQNWQATGRMRGSVTGSEYAAAVSHLLPHPSQQAASVTTNTGPLPVLNYNSSISHLSSVQQSNCNLAGS